MLRSSHPRPANWLLGLGLALLAVFVAFAVVMKFAVRIDRFQSDADLLEELAGATFLDGPAAQGWPQWLGTHRDGVTTMPDLLREWPEGGPPELWRISKGDGYSSFAVRDGRAYTLLSEEDGKESVVCLALQSGKEVWKHSYQPPSARVQYPGTRSTPTLDGGRLYAAGSKGNLLCLSLADGSPVWERDLTEEAGATPPQWGYAFSPLVEGDLVYVMPGGENGKCLAAFHKDTGKLVWTAQDDPAGYSSPVSATIGGVRQVLFFTGRRLLGVTPEQGKLLWEYLWPTDFKVNAATPLVIRAKAGGNELTYVFITSGYNQGCALLKIRPKGDGSFEAKEVYQSNELCCHFSTPVRYQDHVYGLDEKRDMTCLDLRTGEVKWRFARARGRGLAGTGYVKGSLIRCDDLLVVLGESGKLALVEANPERYHEVAAIKPLSGRCWTLPVLAEGKLLIRNQTEIVCLDVRKRQAGADR